MTEIAGHIGQIQAMLRQPRLAPPRKQALQQRLADVQHITGAWHQQGH